MVIMLNVWLGWNGKHADPYTGSGRTEKPPGSANAGSGGLIYMACVK